MLDDDFGPAVPPSAPSPDDANFVDLPITHEALLKGHKKPVSAIALDPSGSRLVSGSHDYSVKFWDFAAMDKNMQSFRSIEPDEGHPIRHLQFSESGDQFLVVSGSSRPCIYSRDGFKQLQFKSGDMYLRDLRNTKGHVSSCTFGMYNPHDRSKVLTASLDGTMRLWDVESAADKNLSVLVCKPKSGTGRLQVTSCTFNHAATQLIGGCSDGSFQLFDPKRVSTSRPNKTLHGAHAVGCDITSLRFAGDDMSLYSRATDSTLKAWDVRNFKEPVTVFDGLECTFQETNVELSPDEDFILSGISARPKSEAKGCIAVIRKSTMEMLPAIEISDSSVVRLAFHPILNQIVVGSGDGVCRVLYDPEASRNGALFCVDRIPRKVELSELHKPLHIITPHSLPMFRDPSSRKRQKMKDLKDPTLAKIPARPMSGPGQGGRIGTSSFTSFLVSSLGLEKPPEYEDPRQALLKYADEPPKFFGAYQTTQPVPIFQEDGDEEESSEPKSKKPKK
eukprot:TRINITY_DN3238_c0_g1_i14.p1 TRINITY_DN3238_c0_g1~~TRINITY_DN3238_c0_g1_i14.p1  ORF type:complete len:506 (-),score=85.45 TRINITY_DN3238_c0_g1_i14:376-1893(-)